MVQFLFTSTFSINKYLILFYNIHKAEKFHNAVFYCFSRKFYQATRRFNIYRLKMNKKKDKVKSIFTKTLSIRVAL